MDRLTIRTVDNDICFEVKKDPEGAYDILDLAKCIDEGDGEEANILLDISRRLAAYEDTGLMPEEIKGLLHDGGIGIAMRRRETEAENARLRTELERMTKERDALKSFIDWTESNFGRHMPPTYHDKFVDLTSGIWRGTDKEGR